MLETSEPLDETFCSGLEPKFAISQNSLQKHKGPLDFRKICSILKQRFYALKDDSGTLTPCEDSKRQVKYGQILRQLRTLKPQNYEEKQFVKDLIGVIKSTASSRKSKRILNNKDNSQTTVQFWDRNYFPNLEKVVKSTEKLQTDNFCNSSLPKMFHTEALFPVIDQETSGDDVNNVDFEQLIQLTQNNTPRFNHENTQIASVENNGYPLIGGNNVTSANCSSKSDDWNFKPNIVTESETSSQYIEETENAYNCLDICRKTVYPIKPSQIPVFNSNITKVELLAKMEHAAMLVNILKKQFLNQMKEKTENLGSDNVPFLLQNTSKGPISGTFELTNEERLRNQAFLSEISMKYKNKIRSTQQSLSDYDSE